MEQLRVLIIDDSLVTRAILTRVLQDDPDIETVEAVATPEEATALLASKKVDVVTIDLEMPGTDGLHYLPTLKRLNLPTLCLSNRIGTDVDLKGLVLMLGATSCWNKVAAIQDAHGLRRLVKKLALGQVRLSRADEKAIDKARERLILRAEELGIREDWQAAGNC